MSEYEKYWMNFRAYRDLLNEEITRRFPNTTIHIVANGDYIKDEILEIREGSYRRRYSPYQMYLRFNDKYEESIIRFCNSWEYTKERKMLWGGSKRG